jgi:hypothetical protein
MIRNRMLIAVLALVLAGCSTIQLRQAQDSYADAVQIESRIRNASDSGDSFMDLTAAQISYKKALADLDKVLAEKSGDLRANKLLGTARVMRALILWRITALDFHELSGICQKGAGGEVVDEPKDEMRKQWYGELRSIGSDLDDKKIFLGTRDLTVYEALYALYAFDILKRINYKSTKLDVQCSIDWFNQSMSHFQKAAAIPGPDHDIQKWLALSNLTVQADYSARLSESVGIDQLLHAGYNPKASVLKAVCPAQDFWDDGEDEKDRAFLKQLREKAKGVGVVLTPETACP